MSPEELEFWAEVERLIKPVVPLAIEYRLHYNELGEIVMCSMANHPESDRYVVTDQATYEQYYRYCVVDNKLVKIDHDAGYRVKLEKSNQGFSVIKNHAGIILEPGETYNETEYYAYRNN